MAADDDRRGSSRLCNRSGLTIPSSGLSNSSMPAFQEEPMLSPADLATYRRDGFIVLPDILTRDEVEALRRVTEEFVRDARSVAANDDIYDLEESHSAAEPRVRRIKTPHLHHPEYARAARHPKIVEVLKDLWGTVRFDTGKLNMKSGGFGAAVALD
jgi:hypothetical protein